MLQTLGTKYIQDTLLRTWNTIFNIDPWPRTELYGNGHGCIPDKMIKDCLREVELEKQRLKNKGKCLKLKKYMYINNAENTALCTFN